MQHSVAVVNARADSVETTIGARPLLRLFTGAAPVDCAASSTGTQLAQYIFPPNWLTDAVNGTKAKAGGLWLDAYAAATGAAGHFRLFDNGATECHMQGTVSGPGGGGDLVIDDANLVAGRAFNVRAISLADPSL